MGPRSKWSSTDSKGVILYVNDLWCCISRYSAGDFTGQILQQCLDLIRYQPPATNLTVPSTVHGEHLTPGPNIDDHREFLVKRKHVSCTTSLKLLTLFRILMYLMLLIFYNNIVRLNYK